MTTTRVCRHCARRKANAPRGLCGGCYARPDVKGRYDVLAPTGRKGFRGAAAWSDDPGLFPCDACLLGAAAVPRGLCRKCEKKGVAACSTC